MAIVAAPLVSPASAPPAPGHPDLDPWQPTASDAWDKRKAAHLLRRAGFGGAPEEIEALVAIGHGRALDLLLTPNQTPLPSFGTRVLPHGEVLDLASDPVDQRAQWIFECVHGLHPLREKLALFWHDHFSVGANKPGAEYQVLQHVNLFRRFGAGSFRTLLYEVSRDPAMLLWLDNYLNGLPQGGQPRINENYGRELLELYTLGAGNYTQADVIDASKCLSGWTLQGAYGSNEFVFRPDYHVPGPKVVLGRTISNGNVGTEGMRDGTDLIDVLLGQPAAAEFLVRKLWRWFVSDVAPDAIIQDLAQRLRDNAWAVGPVLSVMLRSKFFFGPSAYRRLVKSPIEFVAGAIRNLGRPVVEHYKLLGHHVALMGLPLLRYRNPAGLPGGLHWLDAQAVMQRANFAEQLTRITDPYHIGAHFDALRDVNRLGLRSAEQIAAFYLDFLVDADVPSQVFDICVEFMHRLDWVRQPFVFSPDAANRKVRGLVHVIMALPQYSMN
jgi:hypothetical protein